MSVFIVRDGVGGAADQVEMALGADAEPGMAAVMKGFGDGIKADDIAVERGAHFEINDVYGDMIESGHRFLLGAAGQQESEAEGKRNQEFFHAAIYTGSDD